MAISSTDVVPLSHAKDHLAELVDEVRAGREKIITLDGEEFVALVDVRQLEHYHRLAREHAHLTLLEEVGRGLDDIDAGRTISVQELRAKYGR